MGHIQNIVQLAGSYRPVPWAISSEPYRWWAISTGYQLRQCAWSDQRPNLVDLWSDVGITGRELIESTGVYSLLVLYVVPGLRSFMIYWGLGVTIIYIQV